MFTTNILYDDFRSRASAHLEDPNAVLAYKITGDKKKMPDYRLDDREDFAEAMRRLSSACAAAKTKENEIFISNQVRLLFLSLDTTSYANLE